VNSSVANSYDVLVYLITMAMDKSTDLKDLDLTCAGRGVWLVKVRNRTFNRVFRNICRRKSLKASLYNAAENSQS